MGISEFFTLIREMHSSSVVTPVYAFVHGTWRAPCRAVGPAIPHWDFAPLPLPPHHFGFLLFLRQYGAGDYKRSRKFISGTTGSTVTRYLRLHPLARTSFDQVPDNMGHSGPTTSLVDDSDTVRRGAYTFSILRFVLALYLSFCLSANLEHYFRRMKANEIFLVKLCAPTGESLVVLFLSRVLILRYAQTVLDGTTYSGLLNLMDMKEL
ncbi:hypothetical protein IW262DRAFT_1297403 [Armillaria fumosa]|nr:hypothetical protein IW262DRAFT_1297403 [Armillaria fumosa]